MAARRLSHRSIPLIEPNRALELRGTRPAIQARVVIKRRRRGRPRCSIQRAGIAPPHAAGEGLSGATSDGEFGFISGPAGFVGGVPLTRAMNP
jgi:hypothetical protein